jgi:hypothetical protein
MGSGVFWAGILIGFVLSALPFTTKISGFQADKLPPEQRQDARDGKIRLGDLMESGRDSIVSVTVYAYDSFSGSRNVFTDPTARAGDIQPASG